MVLGDERIQFNVQPRLSTTNRVDMDVVFIGHCPGDARWQRFLKEQDSINQLIERGYSRAVEHLRQLAAMKANGIADEGVWTEDDQRAIQLYDLPIPITSFAHLQSLFPAVNVGFSQLDTDQTKESQWLPWAVRDFFEPGNFLQDQRRLWFIRVPEQEGIQAFMPSSQASSLDQDSWSAFEHALSLEGVGLIAMPDLERLLIPKPARTVSDIRFPAYADEFAPCGSRGTRSFAEQNEVVADNQDSIETSLDDFLPDYLFSMVKQLWRRRPDIQWIFSLPLASTIDQASPVLHPGMKRWLSKHKEYERAIAQVQFIYPLLRRKNGPVTSASGLICGHIVNTTYTETVWHSIAGKRLSNDLEAWPLVSREQVIYLREILGVGVLVGRQSELQLDDERLAGSYVKHLAAYRSGEVVRFLGWLQRALTDLGRQMLFILDARESKVRLMVHTFFNDLYQQGALRGSTAEQAFTLHHLSHDDNKIIFEVDIAPSFPIDRIRLTFSHDRFANSQDLQVEVENA